MPDITYRKLQAQVAALGKRIAQDAEAIRAEAQRIDEEAVSTSRTAEMISVMCVDNVTVAETRELAKIMAGVSEAAIAYASAGDNTAKAAKAAYDQNQTSHSGINEAVRRSPVGREIYGVKREWLRQD